MRLSLCVDPGRSWGDVLDLACHAETLGLDGVYLCDHFMPFAADGRAADGAMLEGWTSLAALAGHTQRLRLGTLVLGCTYRHPAVVANMAATMDHITGGRFVLGLGAGGQRNEHVAYGLALPSISRRLDAFEEACTVIRSLLGQPRTTFDGAFFQLAEAPCDPKPVQTPLPLLIGGGGERRTLRIAAQFADEWHVWSTPDEFRHKSEILDGHCEDIGRDPSTIRRATGALVLSSDGRGARDHDDLGAPASVLDQLGAYRAAGADEFIARDHRETSLAESKDSLSLCAEVMATLR